MLIRALGLIAAVACVGCGEGAATDPCAGLPLALCGQPDAGTPDAGAPSGDSVIVDVAWLQARMEDPGVQAVDTRGSGYEASRIPGAIHLVPADLSATIDGVSGQAVSPEQAQPVLRAAGLRQDVIPVVYGDPPEYDAARIVWALRLYGHDDVRYLDGGFDAWVAADGVLDESPTGVAATEYVAELNEDLRVTGDWVLSQLGDAPYDMPAIQLVDARSDGEYGNGHIPSARGVDWNRNLDAGFIRVKAEIEALYQGMDPATTTVTYCASGRRGSFAWLTLVALGYDDVRLYDGSWNEWGADERFPVEE